MSKLHPLIHKVYIIHYHKLKDRKEHIINLFNKLNIDNYEFRSLFDRDKITPEIRNKYYNIIPNSETHKMYGIMNNSVLAITLEHIELYNHIANNDSHDDSWYLIFEDDVTLPPDFVNIMNYYLSIKPIDSDYLDINNFISFEKYYKDRYQEYYATNILSFNKNDKWIKTFHTRTVGSYLINKKTCKLLYQTMIPFSKTIDNQLNDEIYINKLNLYWSNPPFATNQFFESSHYLK